jgi:hypothetical protein
MAGDGRRYKQGAGGRFEPGSVRSARPPMSARGHAHPVRLPPDKLPASAIDAHPAFPIPIVIDYLIAVSSRIQSSQITLQYTPIYTQIHSQPCCPAPINILSLCAQIYPKAPSLAACFSLALCTITISCTTYTNSRLPFHVFSSAETPLLCPSREQWARPRAATLPR